MRSEPMTTAMMIAELMPLHDDELVADIDMTFAAIDRERRIAREQAEIEAMLLDIDWLVAEMLGGVPRRGREPGREALDISLELTPDLAEPAVRTPADYAEVYEVA
jgi:hypothetical protein